MTFALVAILYLLALGLIAMMIADDVRMRRDLLSLRNFAIVGFLLVQLFDAADPILRSFNPNMPDFTVNSPERTGLIFVSWVLLFTAVFLWVNARGWGVTTLARITPRGDARPGMATLWMLAVLLAIVALIMRFSVNVPLIGVLSNIAGTSFAAASAGLIGWIWGPRLFNPVVAFPAGFLLMVNLLGTLAGEFGRRPLAAVGAGFLWGFFYAALRYMPAKRRYSRLAIVALIAVVPLALQTSVRTWQGGLSLGAQVSRIQSGGSVVTGLQMLLSGQETARTSMWLLEQYPESHDYRHLMTLRYFVAYPIPRSYWSGKPYPLSTYVADLANMRGVKLGRTGVTIGPGVIGHAAAEGGIYALILYAVLGGLMLRYFDELVVLSANNPLIVVAVGSTLGQILGLARGEISAFAFTFVFGTATVYAVMLTLSKLLGRVNPAVFQSYVVNEEGEYVPVNDEDGAVEYDAEAAYAYEHGEPA